MAYSLLRIVLRLCAINYDLYDILHGLWTMDHRPKTEIPPRGRDFTQTDKAIEETEFSIFIAYPSAVKHEGLLVKFLRLHPLHI